MAKQQTTNQPKPPSPQGRGAGGEGREQSVLCPKCDQAIFIEQDTQPDGTIICDSCRKKFADYKTLLQAAHHAIPPSIASIPLHLIDPNPEQPRQDFDEAKLNELAGSIKTNGLIQPIVVEPYQPPPSGGPGGAETRFLLHDGERRLRAAKLAGLTEIDAVIVSPGSDPQRLLLRAIVANDQRADLSPIERARGYQKLADEHGLSDKEIARQVGKSRSAVANTRRLLNLPDEIQTKVETGDLSERQAMALIPLYQLPPEIQEKVTDHWDGRKLINPKNLTSDQIRSHLRAATRDQGQALHLVEEGTPYIGDGIRHPKCTSCQLYTKVGQDMLCLDRACLEAKQNQVIAAYLAEATAATGFPPLDPALDDVWQKIDSFYADTGARALYLALRKKCSHLHLAFNRKPWESGPGPESFDRCRYVCLHDDGDKCACAQEVQVDKRKEEKEREKATQRIKNKTCQHLYQIATDNPAEFLRVVLYTITGQGWRSADDKILSLPPEKVTNRLARWLREQAIQLSPYNSPDQNQQNVDTWLAKVGFPPMNGHDPVRAQTSVEPVSPLPVGEGQGVREQAS